jgi:hypothetical protein
LFLLFVLGALSCHILRGDGPMHPFFVALSLF